MNSARRSVDNIVALPLQRAAGRGQTLKGNPDEGSGWQPIRYRWLPRHTALLVLWARVLEVL